MDFPIPPALTPYVAAIWSADEAPAGGSYRVLPGLAPVLGFQLRGALTVERPEGLLPLAVGGITGLLSGPRQFHPQGRTISLLVRFTAFGAWALLGCAMDELADRHLPLADLSPAIEALERRLLDAAHVGTAAAQVTDWLLALLDRQRRPVHPDLRGAVQRIATLHGREPVERTAARLGVGRRQLERLFKLQVGISPKAFASLAQMNWVIERLDHRDAAWADLAAAAGYSDQAHFIRSFRRRTGLTPTAYLREQIAGPAPRRDDAR